MGASEAAGRRKPISGLFFFLPRSLSLLSSSLSLFINLQGIYPGSGAVAVIWKCVFFFSPLFVPVSSEVRPATTVTDKRGASARVGAR